MSFLRKIDLLENKLSSEPPAVVQAGLKFCKAFRSFHKVVESCFGNKLNSDFKLTISSFKQDYLQLGITITPKVFFQKKILI